MTTKMEWPQDRIDHALERPDDYLDRVRPPCTPFERQREGEAFEVEVGDLSQSFFFALQHAGDRVSVAFFAWPQPEFWLNFSTESFLFLSPGAQGWFLCLFSEVVARWVEDDG